ncbi:MAG: 30S ribosomal protein S12 methylthiotransferase RimO [Actinomycetota bacterium]|nr:30S ribosomal protein S12 methylthiotransferase RimO [Actinomycetota bacterium]
MSRPSVAIITLGCARNEVDSEELAGRLAAEGWDLVADAESADAVLVNTCGFVDVAKKDSIDAILAASDLKGDSGPRAVVAVGCLSERYGRDLAAELPEADAVLGFDDYPDISAKLRRIVAGDRPVAHEPSDRRLLLPLAPVDREASHAHVPGHGDGPSPRVRLETGPVASVKLASGCDRRCTFCAIPTFRGSFISRFPADVLAELSELVRTGVKEVVLVSENSTSYGKDLGDLRMLESTLPDLAKQSGITRLRVAYLQPAEIRPGLIETMVATPEVAPYFDLSFQHASASVLRRMRRFGGTDAFMGLVNRIRELDPQAGIRSNVIVGFPGETQDDVDELANFLETARLDAIGVFGYSDEDGTEAVTFTDKIAADVIRERVERITALADEVMAQRAEDRMGETVVVIVERIDEDEDGGLVAVGHAGHQGPDDAETFIAIDEDEVAIGDVLTAIVIDVDGVDLIAELA